MRRLSLSADLEKVARNTVWYKSPDEAINDTYHFIAHVLTYGTFEDLAILRNHVSDAELKEAMEYAPPGVFDPRSWAYWNLILGRYPPPALPRRKLP